jgi:hypothetical protein
MLKTRAEVDKLLEALCQEPTQLLEVTETEQEIVIRKPRKLRKLSQLRGKGKDLWRTEDVRAYLRRERRSWNR